MDSSGSNPGNGQNANLKENIVLAFNEVVQAGAGKFQLWERDTTDSLAFEIDILVHGYIQKQLLIFAERPFVAHVLIINLWDKFVFGFF